MSRPRRLAFLGIGLMGAPMARRLVKAGFETTVWNRTRSKAEALAADGARVADSAAAAAEGADAVITMLEHGAAVTEVVFGSGLAAAARRGAVFIDMSSIPPSLARDHAARLAEMGLRHLDAPVSGGTIGAENGSLAIMAGGPLDDFNQALPVLSAMGRATRVGPSGAGQLAKLANQVIVAVNIGAVAEALLLAEKGGADPAAVREAMQGGFASSRVLEVHGERMLKRDFAPRGRVSVHIKDLRNILDEAERAGLDLPLSREVYRRFLDLRDSMGGGDLDHSALYLQLEATAGKTRQ